MSKFLRAVTALFVILALANVASAQQFSQPYALPGYPVQDYGANNSVTSATTLLPSMAVGGYKSINLQFTAIGAGNTVLPEMSNDGTNFVGAFCSQATDLDAAATQGAFALTSTSIVYSCSTPMRFFKLSVSVYGSGTVTLKGNFRDHRPEGTANVVTTVQASGATDSVNLAQVGGTTVVTGGVNGTIAVGGPAADDAAASGNPVAAGGIQNTTRPIYSNGDRTQLQSDIRGNIGVVLFDNGGTTGTNVSTPNADSASAPTALSVRTFPYVSNGSTFDRARGVVNATDSTGTGIAAAGLVAQCDDTSPTAVTENQFGNVRRDCATASQIVALVPSATAGGTTLHTLTLANTTNATNVKASAGQLYSISGFGIAAAAPVWISLYNNAGTPTCGTSILAQYLIPAATTGAGFAYDFAAPIGFSTGIAYCATTGIAGTGAPAATTYVVNFQFK